MSIKELSLNNLIDLAIETELSIARGKNGKYFVDHHQAFGVLLEEFEELKDEIRHMGACMQSVWEKARADGDPDSILFRFENVSKALIREAIQVAAMVEKYKQTNDLFNGTGK